MAVEQKTDFVEYEALKSFGYSDDFVDGIKLIDEIMKETNDRLKAGAIVIAQCKEQRKHLQRKLQTFKRMRDEMFIKNPLDKKPETFQAS